MSIIFFLAYFSFAFPATLVLISTIELGCRLLGGKAKGMRLESGIFMVTSLLQGLQISLWGLPRQLGGALRFFAFMRVSPFTLWHALDKVVKSVWELRFG